MRLRLIASMLIASSPVLAGPLTSQEFFYDGNGNNVGSAIRNNQTGQTYFYGQQGQPVGNSNPGGPGQTFFYDAQGNNVGSVQGPMFSE